MFCSNCGKTIPVGSTTCAHCKMAVGSGEFSAASYIGSLPEAAPSAPEAEKRPRYTRFTRTTYTTMEDDGGGDVETLRFKVKQERSLSGDVTHTSVWESNRQDWNREKKGTDAVREPNVFWPGEALILNAPCAGGPVSVDAVLVEFPQYTVRLRRGSTGEDGKTEYSGQLWHSSMLQTIGTVRPVPSTVRFIARYDDGESLTWDVPILFDQSKGSYYQLHRNY